MSANGEKNQVIDMFCQMIKAQLDSLSDEQRSALIHTLITELSSPGSSPSSEFAMSPSLVAVENGTANRKKLKKIRAQRAEKKKSVNAFMVFRCKFSCRSTGQLLILVHKAYYSVILIGLPQKARSPILAQMWRTENRQSLFSLLGAAYSKIRDENLAPGVTLESFLHVAAEKVPIIPAAQYFQKSGWTIIGQELRAVAIDEVSVEAEYPLKSNFSPDDVVSYCIHKGLISRMPSPKTRKVVGQLNGASNIAFAALPQGGPVQVQDQNMIAFAVSNNFLSFLLPKKRN